VKGERQLSKSYINEIHAALLRNQITATVVDKFNRVFETEVLKGQYKQLPNNPTTPDGTIHLYCPPEHVDAEMDRLMAMHHAHKSIDVPLEVEAAWLHHRFAQIHPYQDGNGRVARAIASLVFLKADWFPVVVSRDDRVRYIDALESADEGDLGPLTAFFVKVQKRALFQATNAAGEVLPAQTVDEAISSVKRVLAVDPCTSESRIWLRSKETADYLLKIAAARLEQVRETLDQEIKVVRPDFSSATSDTPFNFRTQELGFTVSREAYEKAASLLLGLRNGAPLKEHAITIQAFAIGSKFRGLIGIVAFYVAATGDSQPVAEEPFQVNSAELPENTERRFLPWLERSLARALTLCRQSL
jgi:prophage maintenance system killer protein